jgi:hypothetical protein
MNDSTVPLIGMSFKSFLTVFCFVKLNFQTKMISKSCPFSTPGLRDEAGKKTPTKKSRTCGFKNP